MKLLAIALTLSLSACSTVVPVTSKWPEAPGVLAQQACPSLQKLEAAPELSQVAKTVANNYSEYYQCAAKLDAWQRWYQEQKIIFEGLK